MPITPAYLYCTEADIQGYLSVDGETGRLDDDNTGTLNTTEQGYLQQAIIYATTRVNFYLIPRYDAAVMYQSYFVNQLTVIVACWWLSCRRGNPQPGSLDDLYKQATKDMEQIHGGNFALPDAGERVAAWPAWSNVRVDILCALRKVRVERPISEQSPAPYGQTLDYGSLFIFDPK